MVNPHGFMDGDSPKKRRKKSNKQERDLAQATGGKAQAGSGAVWSSKGDAKDKGQLFVDPNSFLHECKYTSHMSFRVSVDLWREIQEKAFIESRRPAIHLLLGEGKENLKLVVLSEDDYLELRGG